MQETSCSAERPPYTTIKRVLGRGVPEDRLRAPTDDRLGAPTEDRLRARTEDWLSDGVGGTGCSGGITKTLPACHDRPMHWTAADLVMATGGALSGSEHRVVDGVAIDSRAIRPGELFVALRGQRDGHLFVADAIAAGAGGVLVEAGRAPTGVMAVEVPDTAKALLALGSAARDRLTAQVVGITGSVGKTSTKDLVAAATAATRTVTSSLKSFNNELGVPLTLANASEDVQVAVIEMGARGPGHIALLCEIARPTMAVVTAVAAAHTEVFGSLAAIAQAKGELVAALPAGGTAVLNYDDERVRGMASRSRGAANIFYSAAGEPAADVVARDASLDPELRPSFGVKTPWGSAEVRLEARGLHQVGNALAALTVACTCGVPIEAAASALGEARLSPWRMEISRTPSGAVVINDAYNSNPASLSAALDALSAVSASRRIAVLGEMAELGEGSTEAHVAMAGKASAQGIEVVAVGTEAYGVPAVDADAAMDLLRHKRLGSGDAVLLKASRVAGLEHLAARVLAEL